MNLYTFKQIKNDVLWDLSFYDYLNPSFKNIDELVEFQEQNENKYILFINIYNKKVELMVAELGFFNFNVEPLEIELPESLVERYPKKNTLDSYPLTNEIIQYLQDIE